MTTKEFQIVGMTCGHCVVGVTKALKELNLADVKVQIGKAEVTYDETRTDENDLVSAIEEEGYKVIK